MKQTDRDWERWGATDPYYGVLTDKRFRLMSIQHSRAEFFETGDIFVKSVISRIETVFGPLARLRALDFGCGVGRLTQALAKEFQEVVGLDISPSMLTNAIIKPHIRYGLSTDDLSEAPGVFNFVLSYIVLQHIEPARGLGLIAKLLDRVAPDGAALIHVSVRSQRSLRRHAVSFVRSYIPGSNGMLNLLRRRPWSDAQMRMSNYSLANVLELFECAGFGDLITFTENHGGVPTVGFIGRKNRYGSGVS